MSQATQTADFAGQQRAATALLSAFSNPAAEALLSAQADFLMNVESVFTDWLHRRHEAIVDAQRTVARMRESGDVMDMWKAQQEWVSTEMQRLSADAMGCGKLAKIVLTVGSSGAAEGHEAVAEGIQRTAEETKIAPVSRPAKHQQAA